MRVQTLQALRSSAIYLIPLAVNSFEDNNWKGDLWLDRPESKNFSLCADVVLNGIPNHCSTAPWLCPKGQTAVPINDTSFMRILSSANPSYGVAMTGNFFAPTNTAQQPKCAGRWSAVAAMAVDSMSLTANDCAPCVGNDTLVLSGTNYVSWMARHVHASANSRWSNLLRLQDNGFNGGDCAYHTWQFDSVAARNFAVVDPGKWWASADTPRPAPADGARPTCVAHCQAKSNYPPAHRWTTGAANGSALVVFEEELSEAPRLANATLYAAVEVQVLSPATGFAIWIDAGDGKWQQSSGGSMEVAQPKVTSYQATTGASGVARVAVGLFSTAKPPPVAGSLTAELLGPVVVSLVGAPYEQLMGGVDALKSDDNLEANVTCCVFYPLGANNKTKAACEAGGDDKHDGGTYHWSETCCPSPFLRHPHSAACALRHGAWHSSRGLWQAQLRLLPHRAAQQDALRDARQQAQAPAHERAAAPGRHGL